MSQIITDDFAKKPDAPAQPAEQPFAWTTRPIYCGNAMILERVPLCGTPPPEFTRWAAQFRVHGPGGVIVQEIQIPLPVETAGEAFAMAPHAQEKMKDELTIPRVQAATDLPTEFIHSNGFKGRLAGM